MRKYLFKTAALIVALVEAKYLQIVLIVLLCKYGTYLKGIVAPDQIGLKVLWLYSPW
jgi:hypothetical protein